jgi:hypothetical protein
MSDTEVRTGTATEIKKVEGLGFAEKLYELKELGFDIDYEDEDDNYMECDKLAFVGDKTYEIDEIKIDPYADICEASRNPDGSIHFLLKFYNGGTCFNEMFNDAIKQMEETE